MIKKYRVRCFLRKAIQAMQLAEATWNKELYANARQEFLRYWKCRHDPTLIIMR